LVGSPASWILISEHVGLDVAEGRPRLVLDAVVEGLIMPMNAQSDATFTLYPQLTEVQARDFSPSPLICSQ
jgi:hypothetical protein